MTEPASTPVAAVLGPEQTYFRFLAQGAWRVPRCTACQRAVFYPRVLCPFCRASEFDWFEPSGSGTIHSTTVMRRGERAGGDLNLCLIDLDEGFRMMSRVDGVAPDVLAIGNRVKAFIRGDGAASLVLFTLGESQP